MAKRQTTDAAPVVRKRGTIKRRFRLEWTDESGPEANWSAVAIPDVLNEVVVDSSADARLVKTLMLLLDTKLEDKIQGWRTVEVIQRTGAPVEL